MHSFMLLIVIYLNLQSAILECLNLYLAVRQLLGKNKTQQERISVSIYIILNIVLKILKCLDICVII